MRSKVAKLLDSTNAHVINWKWTGVWIFIVIGTLTGGFLLSRLDSLLGSSYNYYYDWSKLS